MLTRGVIAINACLNSYSLSISNTILLIRIILKLGMAPFHHWLPHVISRISWIICIILATIQKIGPICLLIIILPKGYSLLMLISITIRALVGGIGGLNQTQLRPLLAYSSIGHIGWIITTAFCSINLFMFYFITYITISVTLITIIINENYIKTNLSNIIISINPLVFLLIILTIFRLGGLPPLLGFIPK